MDLKTIKAIKFLPLTFYLLVLSPLLIISFAFSEEMEELIRILEKEENMLLQMEYVDKYVKKHGKEKVRQTLEALLKKKGNDPLRKSTIIALGNLKDKKSLDVLTKLLRDPDPSIKANTLYAIWRIGGNEKVVPYAIECLSDSDEDVRGNAAFLLGTLGDLRAVEPLIKTLSDENINVRANAITALGYLGDKRAKPHLIKIYHHDKSPELQHLARNALINLNLSEEERKVFRIPPP